MKLLFMPNTVVPQPLNLHSTCSQGGCCELNYHIHPTTLHVRTGHSAFQGKRRGLLPNHPSRFSTRTQACRFGHTVLCICTYVSFQSFTHTHLQISYLKAHIASANEP
jgi:hypothetical protein